MNNQTPNTMTKTKEQVIEEAIYEAGRNSTHYGLDKWAAKAIVDEYAKQLPSPCVSSPSDLVVEVDGDEKGVYCGWCYLSRDKGKRNVECVQACDPTTLEPPMDIYIVEDRHIRLLTPQGEVVLDNKME